MRYFAGVTQLHISTGSMPGTGQITLNDRHTAHEHHPHCSDCAGTVQRLPRKAGRAMIWIYRHTLSLLVGYNCRHLPTCSVYGDEAIERFGLVGRRLDDAGAAVALPSLGHLGDRQRAADGAAGRALVSAVAVRPLARRQRALKSGRSARRTTGSRAGAAEPRSAADAAASGAVAAAAVRSTRWCRRRRAVRGQLDRQQQIGFMRAPAIADAEIHRLAAPEQLGIGRLISSRGIRRSGRR